MKKSFLFLFFASGSIFAGPDEDLAKAAKDCNPKAATKALENDANPNYLQGSFTPIHSTYSYYRKENLGDCLRVFELLLSKGASIHSYATTNYETNREELSQDWTIVGSIGNGASSATLANVDKFIKVLLKYHPDAVAKSTCNDMLLVELAKSGELEVIDYFLKLGANIDQTTCGYVNEYAGATALHVAVIKGNSKLVEFLISKGANPNIADNAGKTPIDLARERNRNKMVTLLEKYMRLDKSAKTEE